MSQLVKQYPKRHARKTLIDEEHAGTAKKQRASTKTSKATSVTLFEAGRLFESISTRLNSIEKLEKQNSEKLDKLISLLSPRSKKLMGPPLPPPPPPLPVSELPILPMKTVEDLDGLKKTLTGSLTARKELERFLSMRGGQSVDDCIRNMLKATMNDELLAFLTWSGTKPKPAFKDHPMIEVILNVLWADEFTRGARNLWRVEETARNLFKNANNTASKHHRVPPYHPPTPRPDDDSD